MAENWKAILAALLCLPLLLACIFGGEPLSLQSAILNALISFVALLPALPVLFSRRFKRLQNGFLVFLALLVGLEFIDGITPTSQLNHEGTDLLWLFVHAIFAIVATIVVLTCYLVSALHKLRGRSNLQLHSDAGRRR